MKRHEGKTVTECEEAVDKVTNESLDRRAAAQALNELGMNAPLTEITKRAEQIRRQISRGR